MLFELVQKRRSIRRYENKKIEQDKIDKIIRAGLLSPSSRGRRPWEMVVVDDEVLIADLSKSKQHGSAFMESAPLAIVVMADPGISDAWIEDTSIMSIYLQLAAEDLGLGTCWIQIRGREHDEETSSEDYIKRTLNIPDQYVVESIIALGYPAEEKEPVDESQFMEKVHRNEL